jgi:tetratricopeptide (TPR) repeat protein
MNLHDEAINDFETTVKLNPKFYKSYVELARILQKKSSETDSQRLIDLYTQAIDIVTNNSNPEVTPSQTELSALYFERATIYSNSTIDNTEAAIKDLDEAIKLDPSTTDSYYNRGYLKFKLDKYEECIQDYDVVLKSDHNDVYPLLNKGVALTRLNKIQEAAKLFEHILTIDPNHEAAKRSLDFCQSKPDD